MSAEVVESVEEVGSVEEWERWHRETDAARRDPSGALGFTGLHWLNADPQTFPGVPGAWSARDGHAVVAADGGDAGGAEQVLAPGAVFRFEGGEAEIALRGGSVVLRPRLASSPFRDGFAGTPVYQPDARWVVSARFVAHETEIGVDAALPGIRHVLTSPGRIVLTLDGIEHELTLTEGPGGWRLPFTDATSGRETYGAGRSVRIEPVADGETVLVDFTRATNPPCAYSDFTTCPLPPAGNRLPVRVEAGERAPRQRLTDSGAGAVLIPFP